MRLQKFLANAGIASRRKCETLIRDGRVRVNGKIAAIAQEIDPDQDDITVNGVRVRSNRPLYFMLNKPKGYVSTVRDPQGRPTILDLIKTSERIYPIGRLDKDSEGLILLTNDGELAYALTHPKFEIEKVYDVKVAGIPAPEKLEKLRQGIKLEDGITAPCRVRIIEIFKGENACRLEIKLHEGRKREIRRMMKTIGHPVSSLCRVGVGPLKLGNLPSGKFRPLLESEIRELERLHSNHANADEHSG